MAANQSQVIEALAELEAREGALPASLEFCRRLVRLQEELRARLAPPLVKLDSATAKERLGGGKPLLGPEDIAIDSELLADVVGKVAALFDESTGTSATSLAVRPLLDDPGLLRTAALEWLRGQDIPGDEGRVLATVMGAALKPFLVRHAEAVGGLVEVEGWRRGYCPVCGGQPDFAFLEAQSGARWLLCSRCDYRWLYERVGCPACGNQDHASLAYLLTEDGRYRLYVCEHCRHYLKASDLRKAGDKASLPLERYLTLDLDLQAQGQGYLPTA